MTRWSAITRTRGRRSALAYGSRSTTAAEDNLNRLVHHQRGRYSSEIANFRAGFPRLWNQRGGSDMTREVALTAIYQPVEQGWVQARVKSCRK